MILEFYLFKPYKDRLIHGVTKKEVGSFNDELDDFEESLIELAKKSGVHRPIYMDQVHGNEVLYVNEYPKVKPKADSLITNTKNLPLMVKVADCQGVLMYDPKNHAIASVHSGWRGSTKNVIGNTILKMIETFSTDPKDLLIGISPSLGPCCAEFTEPHKELPSFCHSYIKGKHVDFWRMSQDQCMKFGVPLNQIEIAGKCTKCNDDFYSHRRGDMGRMAVFIQLL